MFGFFQCIHEIKTDTCYNRSSSLMEVFEWKIWKKMAGIKAAEFVKDGMVVGLGTGSTAYYFVEEIGRRIKEEGLQITAVTTSSVTSKQAEGLNIPLKSIDQVDFVDVTVDGADEVDSQFNGIKGGGGALLMEKVVATPSKEYIWVVDESKLVEKLGAFKLPVEVVQYGAEQVFRRFERAGYKPSFREKDGQRFVTDMQNFIIDLALDVIEDPIAFRTRIGPCRWCRGARLIQPNGG